ncbi:hypothetical protein V8C37DRAFT_377246 [Trichoderma ceciliae]
MADQVERPNPSGESEDSSKRVQVAMKMIQSMGLNQEMLRSIITSWLAPQFRPEITAEFGQSLTRIQDVGFLGISNKSPEGLRPYRMFDITDRMLVDNIDSSAPYCMVSHRWKDPEINLDLLRKVREDVSKSYPVWYNTDRNDVEIILKYCKEKIKQQRKDVNGCAVKNRLDERLLRKGCYVLSLLEMHHQSKRIRAEVIDAHAHLEKTIHEKKVTDMENRVFRDLNNKAKHDIGRADGSLSADPNKHQPTNGNSNEDSDSIKAAYERVFDAEWEKDKHSDGVKFDALSRELREAVEGMIRCLRLWRSAIKIEQSILKAGEIFDRGLMPDQKQQKSYVWLDTCCIDKSNHNEYSESMSLMGDWYAQSVFTLVHLDAGFDKSPKGSDAEIYWNEFLQTDGDYQKLESLVDRELDQVQNYEDIANEAEVEWSTRGWTLQELVMSRMTYYVNADWRFLHRPVENLGRVYHLIPYIGLYTNPLDVKPTADAWKPEILMTALLNSGTVLQTEAVKAVYPMIQLESDEREIEDGFSLSNALLTSIAMPWTLVDTVFHPAKPEPSQSDEMKVQFSRAALLREISVLWDQTLASQFPQVETNDEKDKEKHKRYKINEHTLLQRNLCTEGSVLHALSIIKVLELVGFCFPKDVTLETAKAEMAQAVFFATMGLIECYDQTQVPIVIQEIPIRGSDGKKLSNEEEKAMLKLKKEVEKRVKLEIRKRLFQELLNSFPEAKEHYSIETIEDLEEKEEAISKTLAYVLHVLVDEVKPLILEDRQYIAEFGNITLLELWTEGTRRHGFTTQEVMTLACERKTTKSFDRAYSLMGILGVRFPTFPAEGYEKALCRLLDETVTTHNDVSVFNWAGYNKGSSMRGRSMYPSTQEAYKAKDGSLPSRNSMSKVEKDRMLRTTSYYHAIISLLRDTIDFLKKHTPTKQEVEWIQYIITIVNHFQLDKLKAPTPDDGKAERPDGHINAQGGKDALPYEVEVLSKFIGHIVNAPTEPVSNPNDHSQNHTMKYRGTEVTMNPYFQPVPDLIAGRQGEDTAQFEQAIASSAIQDAAHTNKASPLVALESSLPAGDIDDGGPPIGRKSRFVEQLSETGPSSAPPIMDSHEKPQSGGEIASEKDEITRYLENWATSFTQGVKADGNLPKHQLPVKVRGIQYKVEEQHEEGHTKKKSSFRSSSMISPHPIIVTNAGIEGIFDIQRVIITMADLQGLWQQVKHATSTEQIVSGYCSISTGFAQVIVQFSCKSGLLRKQLEVIDGIDFSVMKEQNKKDGKKREHKMASKVLWERKRKDKKDREERDGEKNKKKKDEREATSNNLEADLNASANLDDPNSKPEAENGVSEGQQIRDLDEEKTINRMINFIQEDDLRLVAGEWVLARCSGVSDANWFLCHLELGSTHPLYGYRIPTSEIDFNNCTPEDGLVVAWNTYMNRKKEEMCKILTILIKSKERKLKRKRLVGRILRDLAPLDEKAEYVSEGTAPRAVDKGGVNEDQINHVQNDDVYMDDFAPERNNARREMQPSSELQSQDSASSAQQDDMWSTPQDPQSQYSASSVEAQDIWLNQELRPEDSVSNIGDQDVRPGQQRPTFRDSAITTKEDEDDEKSHFWDYLPFIEKVAETKAKHYDKHLSATVLKDTPTVLRQAIENLNDNRDFLPAMFHSAKKIHMF